MNDEDWGKLIDIRDRLPPRAFGDNPTGEIAKRLFEILINDEQPVHIHLAALIVTSRTLQKLFKEGYKTPPETMRRIWEAAIELADSLEIQIDFKDTPEGG